MKLRDPKFRIKFYKALNRLIAEADFSLVVCAIRKVEHVTKYGLEALDPYLLSFDDMLNKLIVELKPEEKGMILAERRNDVLDNQLQLAWLNVKISGTAQVQASDIKERLEDLRLIPKSLNEPGSQLADLVASPIGRHILKIPRKIGHEVDFDVLQKKLTEEITIYPK